MKFKAEIDVMPLAALLDPQGKAVTSGLRNLGFGEIEDVRIGRHITVIIDAVNEKQATARIEDACKRLLSNQIMENYRYHLSPVK